MRMRVRGVIFDVDGTLVDSNDAHAHSWMDAMAEHGHTVSFEKVRPLIGMGGDKVLPETIGIQKESEEGKQIEQSRKEIFQSRYFSQVNAFPATKDLLQRLHDEGLKLVIATSSTEEELNRVLALIGPHVKDLFTQETTSKDAQQSKPDPNIMYAALQKIHCGPDEVVMIGDTGYDIQAAARAGVKTIALRCGGWSDKDLDGAIAIYDDPADLLAHLDHSPLL